MSSSVPAHSSSSNGRVSTSASSSLHSVMLHSEKTKSSHAKSEAISVHSSLPVTSSHVEGARRQPKRQAPLAPKK